MRLRKWRSFKIGNYKIALWELRTRYSGLGFRLGAGHDIVEVCHVIYKNGVEKWKSTRKYKVTFDDKGNK